MSYVFAAILIGLTWGIATVLGMSKLLPIIATIVIVVLMVLFVVRSKAKAAAAARSLEASLNMQAQEHAKTVRPDQQAEIMAMQKEFVTAIGSLKAFGKTGMAALQAMPWYMIIGPPGTGKTTALKASGLQFPYTSKSGGGIKGVGGTRNCEWWLTNEAVLLDTAGRYTTEDDDKDEWFAFLSMLKGNRPLKPVNGVIVAVSIGDIGDAREDDVTSLARRLREKVDEVMNKLGMIVPVYIFFTKCDLIPGFVEMFGDLKKQERGQIWGFTVPLKNAGTNLGGLFVERFDELSKLIETRSMRRLSQERRVETREKIFEFPQQFEVLKANMLEFVNTLFAPNVYQGTPTMRGVYFTSGTQEGRTIDRITSNVLGSLSAQNRPNTMAAPVTETKSYFLTDVFSRVIFPDHEVAARSQEEVKVERRKRAQFAALTFVIAIMVSSLPTFAWKQNKDLLAQTSSAAERVGKARTGEGGAIKMKLRDLEALRAQLTVLNEYHDKALPLQMGFGMYQGEQLRKSMRNLYTAALRDIISVVVEGDRQKLTAFAKKFKSVPDPPSPKEFQENYSILESYILVTDPSKDANEKLLTIPDLMKQGDRRTRLRDYLIKRWNELRGDGGASAEDSKFMALNVDYYLQLLAGDYTLRFDRDLAAQEGARSALKKVRGVTLRLAEIIKETEESGEIESLSLYAIVGSPPKTGPVISLDFTSTAKVDDFVRTPEKVIRAAFTLAGWEQKLRAMFQDPRTAVQGEGWVMGVSAAAEQQNATTALNNLRQAYFDAYKNEWKSLIDSLRVSRPGTPEEVKEEFNWLSKNDPSPFKSLFLAVKDNTTLTEAPVAANQLANSAVGRAAIDVGTRRLRQSIQNRVGGAGGGAVATAVTDAMAKEMGARMKSSLIPPDSVGTFFTGFWRFGVQLPKAGGASGSDSVELDQYEDLLQKLEVELGHATDPGSSKFGDDLLKARTAVNNWITQQDKNWQSQFRNLLNPPLEGLDVSGVPVPNPTDAADPPDAPARTGRRRHGGG